MLADSQRWDSSWLSVTGWSDKIDLPLVNCCADGIILPKRISYLISPNGEIEKIYTSVKPETHATEVLADVALLGK